MGILKRGTNKKVDENKTEPKVTDSSTSKKQDEVSENQKRTVKVDTTGVVLRPHISEKSATLADKNQYVFVVNKDANKVQVRLSIKSMYGVSPVSVNILNVSGKKVRFGRRFGKRSDWKKAVVTLPEGQSINLYEGI